MAFSFILCFTGCDKGRTDGGPCSICDSNSQCDPGYKCETIISRYADYGISGSEISCMKCVAIDPQDATACLCSC